MPPRLRAINLRALLTVLAMSASVAFAQSQWKEIPVGYNMPKSVMAAAPNSAMAAATPFPRAPKTRYAGDGRDMNRPWEIEFHGGGFWNAGGEGGAAAALPAGTPFNSFLSGTPTLLVPSYMFGDGATLVNTIAGAGTIVPLDPVLASQLGKRNSGPSLGIRFGRDLTPRFGLEFSVDWNASAVEIHDRQLLAIEATRSSFENFFPTTFGVPTFISRSQGSQLFYTGAVNVYLRTQGRSIPYLTFGGGGVSNLGPAPHAAILGFYNFNGPNAGHEETDLVNMTARTSRTQPVAILGIGYKFFATPKWGIRFDLRDHISPNATDTILFASPSVATLAGGGVDEFPTNPTMQFSSDPATAPSSLNGAVNGVRTFRGDGFVNQLNFSAGVFYRF